MRVKPVTKKAEKAFYSLFCETKKQFEYMKANYPQEKWGWENTPIEEKESVNMIKDMMRMLERRRKVNEYNFINSVFPEEKTNLEANVLNIMEKHLIDRLNTWEG